MIVHILHTLRLAYYMFLLAGIAATSTNYSHVKFFPSRGAYDAFYEIMLRVVNIASEEFAAYVQELAVRSASSAALSLGSTLTPPRSRSAHSP